MSTANRLVPRYAHTDGLTRLCYSQDGSLLFTVGSNQVVRKFQVNSEEEPESIDNHQDPITGIAVSKDTFCTCSEDATVCVYPIASKGEFSLLTRCTLPVRDVVYSADGEWIIVASDETIVKMVNVKDPMQTHVFRASKKSNKSVSVSPSGNCLIISCCDGTLYMFDLHTRELVHTVRDVILSTESTSEICTTAVWHPSGEYFVAGTHDNGISLVSSTDWSILDTLKNGGHTAPITALAWSSDGLYLASSGQDGRIIVWDIQTRTVVAEQAYGNVVALAWQPFANVLSFTTNQGVLYTWPQVVASVPAALDASKKPSRSHRQREELSSLFGDEEVSVSNDGIDVSRTLVDTESAVDAGMNDFAAEGNDDELDIDADSYMINEDDLQAVRRKRKAQELAAANDQAKKASKKRIFQTDVHPPVHPGSTPWQGNRRYLALNLVGFVWTVRQDEAHHTVTIEFHDESKNKKYHFTDENLYDMACIDDQGVVFAAPGSKSEPGVLHFQPHSDWAGRSEWTVQFPGEDENAVCIALSDRVVVACTTLGYVRVYSRSGFPLRVFRFSFLPFVACVSYKSTIMIVGNEGVGPDGTPRLTAYIENVQGDDEGGLENQTVFQNACMVPLPPQGQLMNVFFSDNGDPYIFDSAGVLLTLLHWRQQGQARWVPVLDTTQLERFVNREERYWPVAVMDNQFHCIILKGALQYPYFPRPMVTEFDMRVPCTQLLGAEEMSVASLEEQCVRFRVLLALLDDRLAADAEDEDTEQSNAIALQRARLQANADKAVLQLVQKSCLEEKNDRSLALVHRLCRPASVLAAQKIALHHNMTSLAEKIGEIATKNANSGN
ncbi:DNA polymerase alpha accessory factor Mcl1 [Schizosaccharomyces japonicus yFS275]|uniref:DNA polymerase alpha accessory factor Mcl1 n=1 Tax=Schizosaccharomyces japonicus (strain yFS275 / FY16936) TaxID=402676 RepID=B6JW49_SCHJY|nr:DNA polymerase alpha accessory factor Mcl1 [Schizosaccharomyces japonicus yFS275]EEB05600.1 DNA polymerase alpha accessory factor Mcl1 [Schizosaccharomyces japonicus yFS275]